VAGETLLTAAVGIAAGIPLALLAIRLALPAHAELSTGWTVAAAAGGLVLAATTQLAPALRTARRGSGRSSPLEGPGPGSRVRWKRPRGKR